MAIEAQTGPGGLPENINQPSKELQEAIIDVVEANKKPNITEFDDGSAIVGEYNEEIEVTTVPFDGNIAESIDESILKGIASDLTASIDDDKSSRQEWEDS